MAVSSEYASILNDLNRDVLRARPADALQYCANWFNKRLEEQRVAHRAGGASLAPDASAVSGHQAASLAASSAGDPASSSSSAGGLFGSNPFGAAGGPKDASPFGSLQPGANVAGQDEEMSGPDTLPPPNALNLGRRTSVSAESLAPASSAAAAPAAPKTVIPKTASQMERIRAAIGDNLLFRNLEEDQYNDVLLAMKEVQVGAQVPVIEQGAQGDYFYVVEAGSLDVYVKPNFVGGTASSRGSVASESDDGGRAAPLTAGGVSTAALGERKVSLGPGHSFGELALLYLQPRAATVLTTSPCTLWALDRVTFRSILMETNSRKRAMYESFLKDVALFEHLNDGERAKISDALEVRTYDLGERPVKQGERGTEFFIIVEGFAEVKKRKADALASGAAEEEQTIGRLGRGDYFGELALLNNAPRAASVVAAAPLAGDAQQASKKLKVAALSERAFTRLLGPLAGIMGRYAEERYGPGASNVPPHVGPTNSHAAPLPGSLAPHESVAASQGPAGGTWAAASPFGGARIQSSSLSYNRSQSSNPLYSFASSPGPHRVTHPSFTFHHSGIVQAKSRQAAAVAAGVEEIACVASLLRSLLAPS